MEPQSRNEHRSTSFSLPEGWRKPSNLKTMSISELFSELRDTFMRRDFDLVEKTLISREEMLKEEIEKKNRELELSEERIKFERLERRTVEFKLERIQEEMNKKVSMKNVNERSDVVDVKNRLVSDGVASPVAEMGMNEEVLMESGTGNAGKWGMEFERGEVVAVKNRLVGDDDGVASADVEMASENVGVLVKEKKGDDEQRKKDRLSASVFRKTTLKEAIEDKVVRKLLENNKFKSWGRINVGIEVKTDTEERRGEELMKVGENGKGFRLDDGKVVKAGVGREKCKFEALKNRGFGDGEATATELVGEKVDVLAETLVVRKAMIKSAVEEMVGELEENNHFKSLGRINYEIEVKTVVGESCGFGLDDGKFVKAGVGHEKCKFEVLKNRGVGDGEALAPAKLASEKVKVLAEKKRFVGASDTEWQSSSGAVQKNLDTRLAKPTAIPPGDAMRKAAIAENIMLLQKKNQFKSSGRLNFDVEGVTVNGESCGEKLVKDGKVVNAKLGHERCKLEVLKNSGVGDGQASAVAKLKDQKVEVLAETKRLAGEPSKKDDLGSSGKNQKYSSGAVQENLATKLVESIGIKRDFPFVDMDILDALDSSDSSSSSSGSSSSDEFDMIINNKKMRTNANQPTNGLY